MAEKAKRENKKPNNSEENTLFIGKKDFNTYITSILLQLNKGAKKIYIKARGRSISRAVDLSQATINKFCNNVVIGKVEIGTEILEKEGQKINVSTISIEVIKQ